MSDEAKVALGSVIAVCLLGVMLAASDVGEARAKAAQACFEAAKVNHNIKCEEGEKE